MTAAKGREKKTKATVNPEESTNDVVNFPIIGLGASAGGLEAFEQFFRNVPAGSGMAFILVSHLDPGHVSMLSEILQRVSTMPVIEVKDQMKVEANHVYVIPPNSDMSIFNGVLQIGIPELNRGMRMPIDFFLRSLADEQAERSIGVILSGNGSDGTLGLRAILGAGGVSFIQDPSTAKYDGMPRSAIQSELATYVLPVEKIPEQIIKYVREFIRTDVSPIPLIPSVQNAFAKIFVTLRAKTGHDFSLYKQSTIRRRIERRMAVHNLDSHEAYARFLDGNPAEVHLLFKELLINVTSFFRDKEAFIALKEEALPPLFSNKLEDHIFRIWVAGCATGEEAYSIAMLFREYMDEINREYKVQIYSTDIDEDAIAIARAGIYPANISIDITPDRIRRFFIKNETGFRIKKEIREMVVFAVQNVIKDPPFTKMDIISCRNLLIYLEPELQNLVISAFHYALRPGGVLFLGPSESIGNLSDSFSPLNRKWKVFTAQGLPGLNRKIGVQGFSWVGGLDKRRAAGAAKRGTEISFAELTQKALVQTFAPPSVITDTKGNILYVHGDTGKYLQPAKGEASLNIIDMSRQGLALEMRNAIHTASTQKNQVVYRNLQVKTNGDVHGVDCIVRPLTDPAATQEFLIVSFLDNEPVPPDKPALTKRSAAKGPQKRVEELEQELMYTKENLQSTIEEMQSSNEELKSTNEELQSTNEELQSTNEELETSKEELQSVNEELITVNAELQAKIEQLAGIQNDIKNLMENMNVGTIFLDESLKIKRFTQEATHVFRLAISDTGRPLADIKSVILNEDLIADSQIVIDSLIPIEKQVITIDNEWYLVRIMPYRTLENVIDGVVLTFNNITELHKVAALAKSTQEYAENIVNAIRDPLIILNEELMVISANESYYRTFYSTKQETVGHLITELIDNHLEVSQLSDLLGKIVPGDSILENTEIEIDFPKTGHRKMLINARKIQGEEGATPLILLAMEEIIK